MSSPAINSSLGGIATAAAQFNSAARTIASTGLPGAGAADLVDGVVNASTANVAMEVNISMLRQAMDQEKHLINVLVE